MSRVEQRQAGRGKDRQGGAKTDRVEQSHTEWTWAQNIQTRQDIAKQRQEGLRNAVHIWAEHAEQNKS